VQEATRAAGARDVLLAPSSMAAAIGAELPVRDPVGSMVVDIGAGHTDVAITSLGGFVVARSSSAGGDALDHAIRTWLRDKHDLLVGERTAEGIKHRVGAADRVDPMLRTRIRGRDATTGVPREVDLDSTAIADALAPAVTAIRETVLSALAAAPPEISSDILARGILLCGGTAKLRRIEAHLGDAIGLPVLQADDPGRCVARGAARLLDDPVLFDRIAIAA
jgi:rod shape-determining protein MreB